MDELWFNLTLTDGHSDDRLRMKRKWIVLLIAILVAATGHYALSTSTARSDKAILRTEFGVPPSAKVVHYRASPETGMIPLPREGLDIEVVFQFDREAKKLSRTVTAFLLSGYGTRESLFSADVGP
jgi:hypothetical protein